MSHRNRNNTQQTSAAKAGISIRSGRRIEKQLLSHRQSPPPRRWRTREDPLAGVWADVLVPLLERAPRLTGLTLFEYLEEHFPGQYPASVLRTLQRRVSTWRATHGPEKIAIIRQQAVPGDMGLSDFSHPNTPVRVGGEPFEHLFFQYRLAYSGWRSVTVVRGGESYSALSSGLQRALHQCGGAPKIHRTDSLSAARNNRVNQWCDRYADLCDHYGVKPTHNNVGVSHENGAIECAHGSFKRRLEQALLVRGNADFDTPEDYQRFVDTVTWAQPARQCGVRRGTGVTASAAQAWL